MKVAVLGATGSTGRLVVDRLLAAGHQVLAVHRSGSTTPEPGRQIEIRVGDVTDAAFLRDAIADCAAVVSCIGQTRASKSLFARRVSPPDILRRVAEATIAAIGDGGQHLVYLSAFGVGSDRRRHALAFRIVLRLSSINDAYLDHAEAERAIRASAVDWTIVRPPGLTDAERDVPLVDRGDRWSSFETVSRRSLAGFLVSVVENHGPSERTITIGEEDGSKH